MAEPVNDKSAETSESQAKSLDPIEIARDEGSKDLKQQQSAEKAEITKEHSSAVAKVESDSARARADLIVFTPEKKTEQQPPESKLQVLQDPNLFSVLQEISRSEVVGDLIILLKKKIGPTADTEMTRSFDFLEKNPDNIKRFVPNFDVSKKLDRSDRSLQFAILLEIADITPQEKDIKASEGKVTTLEIFQQSFEKLTSDAKTNAQPAETERLKYVEEKLRSIFDKNKTAKASPSSAPTASPTPTASTPASEKSMWSKISDSLGKMFEGFKNFFASFGTKISDFFEKIFKKKNPASSTTSGSGPKTSSTEKPAGVDSSWGLTGDDLLEFPAFKTRSQEIATKIGVSLDDLYAIFKMEGVKNGKVDASAVNPTSGASGLIQWMPKYAPSYGTTVEQIRQMSGLQQLEYVEKYFKPYFGKLHSFSDMYRAVFFPAAIGKSPEYIFGAPDMAYARTVANQNSGIARYSKRSDGLIDNACFEAYCATKKRGSSTLPLA